MFVIPRSGAAPKPRVLKGNWYEEHLATEVILFHLQKDVIYSCSLNSPNMLKKDKMMI